ncbi:unnamed protein product [Tuber aestivum]|uniref:Uncharacterized protein n=1 Tax=Tuber aestivum TaxID=59557 RepID=A0A292Q8L0_9PEZI|nr:unnamed protein product [Tuber aestivum]
MKFQLFAVFAILLALTLSAPVSQSESPPRSNPVCSTTQGALIEDCREALTKIPMQWPRICPAIVITSFDAATVRTCRIRTWDTASAHCLEGEAIVLAVNMITSWCTRGATRVVGKNSLPWGSDKTGVEIVWVQDTVP